MYYSSACVSMIGRLTELSAYWRPCIKRYSNFYIVWGKKVSRHYVKSARYYSQGGLSANEELKQTPRFSQKRLKKICRELRKSSTIRAAAKDFGIEDDLYHGVMRSFCSLIRSPCNISSKSGLSEVLLAVHEGECLLDDLFPYFIEHTRQKHPLVLAMRDLKIVSDLSDPLNWYPCAKSIKRNFVLHLGPTNSGKTHHAHRHFLSADSGIYCSPLRMLAAEIYQKTNEEGVACDLVTGEERLYASGCEDDPAHHTACTVEMANIHSTSPYDVAVIDEIQMIGNDDRGGAWTRALLGIPAKTVHVCGEPTVLPLIQKLVKSIKGTLEVNEYDRLIPLVPLKRSLKGRYGNIRPGDCVVTFSRSKIYKIKREIEATTLQPCAVVYGGLPAGTRNRQAKLFNGSKAKVLVASDAVGMGLNLNIKRVVFHTLDKFDGMDYQCLSPSQTRQIAGRAGRFGQDHTRGEVTTLYERDLSVLHQLMIMPVPTIKKAGLSPTFEQVELFSSHLPGLGLPKILSVFLETANVSENYFLCEEALKRQIAISEIISPYKLSLRESYILSLAPLDIRKSSIKTLYLKLIKLFSEGEPVTVDHLCELLQWPIPPPRSHTQMIELENAHEMIDLYLWLSLRYPDLFPCPEESRLLQDQLEDMIGHSLKLKI